MGLKNSLCFLGFFIFAVSTVAALNCIACTEYIDPNATDVTNMNNATNCRTRTDGPGIPCEKDQVCSTIYNPKTNLLTRGCDHQDICKNTANNCTTCSTELCGNSGFHINPLFAPVLAGIIFAVLGR